MVTLKIHIIGGPGSGKSFVAEQLSHRYGIPAFALDEIFWDKTSDRYGIRANETTRDEDLRAIISRDAWIVEGVYYQWLNSSFERADIVLLLVVPRWLRHWRIVRRFIMRKLGLSRSKKESLRSLWELLKWNNRYDVRNLVPARRTIERLNPGVALCRSLDDALRAVEQTMTQQARPAQRR